VPPEFPERERHALEKTTRRYLQLLFREALRSRLQQIKSENNGRQDSDDDAA
jgi:hypothetical protein